MHYPDLGSDASSVWKFLRTFLRHHFAGKPSGYTLRDFFSLLPFMFSWIYTTHDLVPLTHDFVLMTHDLLPITHDCLLLQSSLSPFSTQHTYSVFHPPPPPYNMHTTCKTVFTTFYGWASPLQTPHTGSCCSVIRSSSCSFVQSNIEKVIAEPRHISHCSLIRPVTLSFTVLLMCRL